MKNRTLCIAQKFRGTVYIFTDLSMWLYLCLAIGIVEYMADVSEIGQCHNPMYISHTILAGHPAMALNLLTSVRLFTSCLQAPLARNLGCSGYLLGSWWSKLTQAYTSSLDTWQWLSCIESQLSLGLICDGHSHITLSKNRRMCIYLGSFYCCSAPRRDEFSHLVLISVVLCIFLLSHPEAATLVIAFLISTRWSIWVEKQLTAVNILETAG